jgi:aminotransferase EvaB
MMKVRYSYLGQQFADPEEIFGQMREFLKTGAFTLGPPVEQFEKSFAKLIGTKYAVGVGSGTDALKLSLKACGVGHGDEVITAANTFIATAGAINEIGAVPRFVDATPYYTMNVEQIENAITSRTKAIMPVHLTGEPADMTAILEIAKKHHLVVIEDACQSILSNYKGKNTGTMGKAAGFSLHPLKNLNVWGDAGVVVTNDEETYKKLLLLRNHGMKNRDEIDVFGYNSRLDSLQAIVGNWLIKDTDKITDARIANGAIYDAAFSKMEGHVRLAPRRKEVKRVFHLYMLEVAKQVRNDLVQYLLDKGVDAKIHYPIPLYQQKGLNHLGYVPGTFPETDRQADEVLSLPVDQHLSREQIQYTIETVQSFFK